MQKFIVMGRLVRDVETVYSQGEKALAISKFSLAVDRKFHKGDDPTADFFNCVSFGKQAEFCEKYLKQGIKVVIVGRVENNNYTNKDGQKIYGNQIMVEEIEFAESKKDDGGQGGTSKGQSSGAVSDGFMNLVDGSTDDLPFN